MDSPDGRLNRLPRGLLVALAAPPAVVLALFVALPVVTLAVRTVDPSAIGDALTSPSLARIAWFTVWQATVSTVVALVVGTPIAYLVHRREFAGRRLLTVLLTVPFMLPTVVSGAALLTLLPRGSWWSIVIAHAYVNLAVVVRLVGPAFAALPHDLVGAARTLGANQINVARWVIAPLLVPAVAGAATIVAFFSATSFGIVRILGDATTSTVEVEVARRALRYGDVGGAVVLSALQLGALGVVAVVAARLQTRTSRTLRGDSRVVRAGTRKERVGTTAVGAAALVAVALPLVLLVLRSFRTGGRWTTRAWTDWGTGDIRPGISLGVRPVDAALSSLTTALVATALCLVVGSAASFAIVEARRAGRMLDIGSMLPLGLSGVTVGLGLLVTFDAPPFDWRASWWIVPVGHSLIGLPFVVRMIVTRLRTIDPDQRSAALVLGASPTRAWFEVSVRRSLPVLGPASALAAALSLGEFGATTLLSRSGDETLPLAIAGLLGRPGDLPRAQGFVLATVLMLVTVLLVVVSEEGLRARRP